MALKPISGRRYSFPLDNYTMRRKSGLFTGEIDRNGLAILITKSGERWKIPVKDLREEGSRGNVTNRV